MIDTAPTHTHPVFDPRTFAPVVDWVVSTARAARYGALAACGHSGLIVAGAACYILGVPIIAVRKPDDHAKGDYRGVNAVLPDGVASYAFVDDIICTGGTFEHVIFVVAGLDHGPACAGVILYNQSPADPFTWTHLPDALRALPFHIRPKRDI